MGTDQMHTNPSKSMPESMTEDAKSPETGVIRKLEGLHKMLVDAVKGYEIAITNTDIPELKAALDESKQMHERHHAALHAVLAHYEDVTDDGTLAGKLHRAWIDIKGELTDDNPAVILESVRFGERQLDKAYTDALGGPAFETTAADWHRIVAQQQDAHQQRLQTIEQLYNEYNGR